MHRIKGVCLVTFGYGRSVCWVHKMRPNIHPNLLGFVLLGLTYAVAQFCFHNCTFSPNLQQVR
jgi:hypothetical protein